jgi:DNA-binding YbaB/EbfC family protein
MPKQNLGGGGFNQKDLMRQAQMLQQKLAEAQDEIRRSKITTTAGGGAVSVTISGEQRVEEITIEPDLLNPEEREMLQDLLITAINDAFQQLQDKQNQSLGGLTGGLKIPGLS